MVRRQLAFAEAVASVAHRAIGMFPLTKVKLEMNTRRFAVVTALVVLIGLAACGAAPAGDITVKDAWARPTAKMAMGTPTETPKAAMGEAMTKTQSMQMDGPVSAAYMVIENKTAKADRLMSATSSVADVTEVHETVQMENGMMGMQPVQGGLEIPANGSVTLKPGSYHIMMMKLRQDLSAGQTIKLTLKFQSGKEIALDVPVKQPQ
jgi:periplasmic copper chaperone A